MNAMKKLIFTIQLLSLSLFVSFAQNKDSALWYNSAERLLRTDGNLTIGGYGEVHYNQPLDADMYKNGTIDVHRLVLLVGYNFTPTTKFVSEVEFEHTSVLEVEQLFIDQKIFKNHSLRAGLVLIPVGIINVYHEPTTFNGVERPQLDSKIIPSTWRDVGVGLTGNFLPLSLRYEAYLVNGPLSYNGTSGLFKGNNGFRSGRQQGNNATISSANFTGRIEYFGIRSLNIGFSTYLGKSQSTLYNNVNKNDNLAISRADSSVVGISIFETDIRYKRKGFEARGQIAYSGFSNTKQYNQFTSNNLGKSMLGYYVEAGYDLMTLLNKSDHEFIPFVRYQMVDTHYSVDENVTKNDSYHLSIITAGISYRISKGSVFKIDMDFIKDKASNNTQKVFNAGIGVMF